MKSLIQIILLVHILATALVAKHSEVHITIQRDTVLTGTLFIDEWTTLHINAGVTIAFSGYQKMVIKGVVLAAGTAEKPITITSENRPHGSQAAPGWAGFMIVGAKAQGMFTHCRIEGAYKNIVYEAMAIFDSCEFAGNHYALYCMKKASAHIKNCRVYRNVYGVVSDCSSPLLLGNTITENTVGLYVQLGSGCTAGKNSIVNNETNIKSEKTFGPTKDALSLQYLWEVMRDFY